METVLDRIMERLKAVKMSPRRASTEAGLGPDYIRDLKRKTVRSPSVEAIRKLAPVLETTTEWLVGKTDGNGFYNPPPPILGSETLPLYRSVEGGPGYIVVSHEPIGYVPRPAKLEGNKEAYAVVVAGESMSPEFEAGDMLFVDPYKPLVRDRNFIFVADQHGDWRACVKRLISWTQEEFVVRQHNPPPGQTHQFTLPRSEWNKAFRVLGKFDRE